MALASTTLLNDLFILPRAGRYANPEREAAALPLVYGDLTDGSAGIWELPQIDTTPGAKVFCFAGHPVLSAAGGNSVSLYDDDGLIAPGEYTFDESNDFEAQGAISTASFTVDPNGAVKARGKGKASGSTLIENPISVAEDILVNVIGLGVSADVFDATALEDARERAASAAYKAAGVIQEDFSPGEAIQQVLASFLGTWFLRKDRKVFIFLESELSSAGSLPFKDSMQGFIVARQRGEAAVGPRRREEIINRPAAFYRFNYAEGEFSGFDDGTAEQDLLSVGVHGALGRTDGPFEMKWVRDLTTLQAVQAVIVSLFKNSPRVFEVEQKGETLLGLERADHVSLSLDFAKDPLNRSDLRNQICRVLSKEYDHQAGSLRLRLLDTRFFLTDPCVADGSCAADGSRKAGNDRDTVLRG